MIQNKSTVCSNCGTDLPDKENYCPNCGQKNTDLNISIKDIAKELGSDYFTFDSKFFNTLGPLLFKPGKVPKEYIDGKRVDHIPPLRMFIFLSFITFFLWGLSFDNNKSSDDSESVVADSTLVEDSNADQLTLNSFSDDIGIQIALDSTVSDTSGSLSYLLNKDLDPREIVDSIAFEESEVIKTFLYQALRMYQAEEGVVVKYFMGNLSLVLLFLQPFFALLLKLVYIRRKSFYYIEHLVFSLYFHAFILLITIGLFFISLYTSTSDLILWLLLLSLVYLAFALKRFYEQPWGKTLVKGAVISFTYLALIFPTFMLAYFILSLYFY